MIKLSALNEESDDDTDCEEEVTKEALEQLALQQYAKALDLQRKGKLIEATELLNDLLETELLDNVKKPALGEKSKDPLFNLKYLCYKNVASMQCTSGETDKSIESYTAAADLDDTDVTLWHKFGLTCMKALEYEKALYAFLRGTDCNPRHWPCIDKIVTLQMGLNLHNDCVATIYNALELDAGYLRGLVYRRHIYTNFSYIKDFLIYLDAKYQWNPKEDGIIDEIKAEKLLKDAEEINNIFIEQVNSQKIKCSRPILQLIKPISDLTWNSVGDSLTRMHSYIKDKCYSHACIIELTFEKGDKGEEKMEVCKDQDPIEIEVKLNEISEAKLDENVMEIDKNIENGSDDNNDFSDKAATDNEKVESDVEAPSTDVILDCTQPQVTESKEIKKVPVRRRGSALSFLNQWEWCKRRSGRKKTNCKQDRDDTSIYENLRRLVPLWLVHDTIKENKQRENSPETMDLNKLFENKQKINDNLITDTKYFGTEEEQKDVKDYIEKYTQNKCDIIELLQEYLNFLSRKWKIKWPDELHKIFVKANKCFGEHIDVPACSVDNSDDILNYSFVNMLSEELHINYKLNYKSNEKEYHELNIIESIGILLNTNPDIYGSDCFELTLRYLWNKLHIHLFNKHEQLALDSLYQLVYEFEVMGEHNSSYCLELINFTFKPLIKLSEIMNYIKFLERNKKLSTVVELYDHGNFEEVLSIIIDSFEHCKNLARKQEEKMSLDFAVQLTLILDCYWELGKIEDCIKWSLTCLHESLKHYFRLNSGNPEYSKWSSTVVKILCCIEHIFKTEGLTCLEVITQKELSVAIEDLIRIIGHQVETNASDLPLGTVIPWMILYYIFQKEDDQGRSRKFDDKDCADGDEIPNPIMVLFIGHQQLGNHGWCGNNDAQLLYFILDTVVPRLRSPSLARSLEQVNQHMEQSVFCLFGHPGKKTKLKYLVDHKVTPHSLDWNRAQQIYEIFRPTMMPEVEGKAPSISAESEQLFHRILAILPSESDPQKYVPDIEKYLFGKIDKVPTIPILLPYKMKDIYFLLGDYYFKKEERKRSIKFNILDVIVNNDRFESWAEIALAKAANLELKVNSCSNLDNDKDYLNPASIIIRCFKRALEIDTMHCNLWIEYGVFVYWGYSYCSRLLKHASESLSMSDFEALEKQKDLLLHSTQKCFSTVIQDRLNNSTDDKVNDEMWLHYYMMGKVAEKRNKTPSVFLDFYHKAVISLNEADAIYPLKINYNSPQHLSIEVLELNYRIHASILKYIEQHEKKPIPSSIGKIFTKSIEQWKNGPFSKNPKKDETNDTDIDTIEKDNIYQAGNILKRSISDAGEEDNQETKRMKLECAAAKVRRSASYDTERTNNKDVSNSLTQEIEIAGNLQNNEQNSNLDNMQSLNLQIDSTKVNDQDNNKYNIENKTNEYIKEAVADKKDDSTSSPSSSSSDSSSDESSSSSSESSRETNTSNKSMTDEEIMTIITSCLDALEDCSIRFPQHYKALYRLAHYHFYSKKGKDIERCRDLMLSTYMSRTNVKVGGLFCERKQTNFFNSVWRIPSNEVDRPGGFSCHMSRCVLLTIEILKEIDDHKTLLELSQHLHRVPDPDKKYLRDADREDLAQQAFTLCVQSLKGQLIKFSQQPDLKSNEIERQALNSLMLDIYRAYLKTQKHSNSKQFTNLLIDGYKLVSPAPITENTNLTDISLKYCQSLISALKQKATIASLDKSNQNAQKKQARAAASLATSVPNTLTSTTTSTITTIAADVNRSTSTSYSKSDINKLTNSFLPNMSSQEKATALQNYLPLMSQQTAAAFLLFYNNLSGFDNYNMQNPLQPPMQNTFQSEFYRQFFSTNMSYNMPPKKSSKPKDKISKQTATTSASTYKSNTSTSTSSTSKHTAATSTYSSSKHIGSSSAYSTSKHTASTSTYTTSKHMTSSNSHLTSKHTASANTHSTSKHTSSSTSYSSKHTAPASTYSTSKQTIPTSAYSTSKHTVPTSAYSTSKHTASTNMLNTQAKGGGSFIPQSQTTYNKNMPSVSNMSTASATLGSVMPTNISSSYTTVQSSHKINSSALQPVQAHIATTTTSTVNAALQTKPPLPHEQVSPGKTLQEKLAERQKHNPIHTIQDSLNRLPSSLTVTKTGVNSKKSEAIKALAFNNVKEKRPPTICSDEIIVLDDDD